MKRNFKQHFDIIYDKFILYAKDRDMASSNMALARYLGHQNDGKVKAWKKGQWPSAEDCAIIEEKFGFSLRWLVTGEGSMYEVEPSLPPPDSEAALIARMAGMEERIRELKYTVELQKQLLEKQDSAFLSDTTVPGGSSVARALPEDSKQRGRKPSPS